MVAGGKVVGTEQAAERLGLEVSWIRRLLARGELGGLKVGSSWVIAVEDLEAFARRQRHGPGRRPRRARP